MFNCLRGAVELLGWFVVCITLLGFSIKFLDDGGHDD